MTKPTPKPIRERAWVRLLDDGRYARTLFKDKALLLWEKKSDAAYGDCEAVEVEIRSVPRKARKRARKS
jgi:hypothetical protein